MTEQVEKAAMWLSEQKETQQQVIPLLRERFLLTAFQAAQACTLANQYRTNRRAFG